MNISLFKNLKWFFVDQFMFWGGSSGGGGGNPAPTQTNVTNTNIPEYAQPYVETMLGAAQQQIFNYDDAGNVLSMKPYTPYSSTATDYVAGFSPLQQQAQSNIANMQTPGSYATGQDYATTAGLGALSTANPAMQYGGLGATYGGLGAQTGLGYGQQATNAQAVGAYMNPYLQNVLSPAMQLQQQQFGQIGAQNQAQATQQGAFGGGRQAVMQGLNQQNQMLAQNQLVGQGYSNAYDTAQRNMQAAASLGMQGTAQGMQGAQAGLQGVQGAQAAYQQLGAQGANMANIAGQETQTGLNIAQAQQAAGAAQQAQQQNIINQQIQNYATAQQYPMTQLANMSSLLRGLPMQATTTQSYQAAPSSVSTLAGLGTAGLGAYKMATAAEGGSTKDIVKMAKGGIASGVPAPKLDAMLGRLDDKQLAQKADPRTNDPQTAQAAAGQQSFRSQMRPAGIGQNYKFNAAGGGIVAFAEGDVVKDDSSIKSMLMKEYSTPMEEAIAKSKAMQPKTDFATKYGDMLAQAGLTTESDAAASQGLRLLQAGAGMMGGASPFAGVNIGQGVQPAIAGYAQDVKEQKAAKMDLAKQQFELGKFGYNTEADIVKAYREDKKATRDDLVKILGSETAADAAIKSAQIHAGATVQAAGIAAEKAGAKDKAGIKIEYDALVAQGYDPNSPITMQKAQQQYFAATRPYGATQVASAIGDRLAKDQELTNLFKQQRLLEFTGTDAEKQALAAKIETRRRQVESEFNAQLGNARGGGGGQPVVNPNMPGSVQVPPLPPGFKPVG
jgi:hypothetical protein